MSQLNLNNKIDNDNMFLLDVSDLDDRYDPSYYKLKNQTIRNFRYPLKKLGTSFIVKDGDHDKLPSEAIATNENGRRYLRSQDLKNNRIISEKPIYVSEDYFNSVKRCHIFPGDLLFSIMASVGATAIVPDDFAICTANRAIGILRPKPNSVLIPEYVEALLNTNIGTTLLELQKRGGIQQRINLSDIHDLQLPAPDRDTQIEIAEIYKQALETKEQWKKEAQNLLNDIDKYLLSELGIDLPAEKNSKLKSRIFTRRLADISGTRLDPNYHKKIEYIANQQARYPCVRLKELIRCPPQYGANEPAIDSNRIFDTRYIRITDINEIGELTKTSWKTAKTIEKKYLLNYNDLLFARSGSVGRAYLHKETGERAIFAGYLIRFILDETRANPNYIFYYCHSAIYKFWVDAIHRPAVQSNINAEEYKSLLIRLPSLNKQNEISQNIKTLRDKSKQLREKADKHLDKIKQEIEGSIFSQ